MIKKIDHFVLTVKELEKSAKFYEKLGFELRKTEQRYELLSSNFKINLHLKDQELSPHAKNICLGCNDLCFELSISLEAFKKLLLKKNIKIEQDIISKNGFKGPMKSLYIRDLDGNLLEFCSYLP